MARYIVYPGYGVTAPGEVESYIEAAELAALYGLGVDDYEVGTYTAETGTAFDADHIHLIPRPDGLYRNIKTELGDTASGLYYDKMVGYDKWREENEDNDIKRNRP
jgi:hypothetical protein